MEGVATADAPEAFEGSAHSTVFVDGFDKVMTACRLESAFGAEQRADRPLIKSNGENH